MSTSTEVDQWAEAHAQLSPIARERWEVGEVRTIRNAVAPDLSPAEFQMFMAMAAKYELDPLAKEIWGAKGKSRDGREGRVLIMVGRDGLLKVARRDQTYAGFDSDVVRKNDEFRVLRNKDGREIIHNYEGAADDEGRGPIIGAWAQVYQKGYHDTYFFAPMDEYRPSDLSKAPVWKNQPSVMIQKCALALCLRLAFNLSGVVAEEEAARFDSDYPDDERADDDALGRAYESAPEELRERLERAVREAAELRPGVVTPAAIQMTVTGATPEAVEAYAATIERENAEARALRDVLSDAEEPAEAEVVEEPGADPEALRRRLSDLYDRRTDIDSQPEVYQAAAELVDEEIAAVEAELAAAGGDVPGQEAMEV